MCCQTELRIIRSYKLPHRFYNIVPRNWTGKWTSDDAILYIGLLWIYWSMGHNATLFVRQARVNILERSILRSSAPAIDDN